METSPILYIQSGTEPRPVAALVYNGMVHIHDLETKILLNAYSLKSASYEQVQGEHRLMLSGSRFEYLLIPEEHVLLYTLPRELKDARLGLRGKVTASRMLVWFSLFAALVIGVYFAMISFIPWMGSKIISREREISIGNELFEAMMQDETIDSAGTRKLVAFADHLKLSDAYPIRLTLVNSKTVNAFAMPGGHIVVYTGLLQKISSPEELTALLAHESTHVNKRHTLKSLLRKVANTIIIAVVFGDASGIAGALIGNADALQELSYSRSLETEADEEGMRLMLDNEVDAGGMKQLMLTLQKEEGNVSDAASFFSSHPLTRERIKKADRFLRKHNTEFSKRSDLHRAFSTLKGGSTW